MADQMGKTLTNEEREFLCTITEAWLSLPNGSRRYFQIGYEMASGDHDGTFIMHSGLSKGTLRTNRVLLNSLAKDGLIEVLSADTEQCFGLTKQGEIIYRRLVSENPTDPPELQSHRRLSPSEPYGSLLTLRRYIRTARNRLSWFEQHLPSKALEVLYPEIKQKREVSIRLLSGEKNLSRTIQKDFKRFKEELVGKGFPEPGWRVLPEERARVIHGRFLFTDNGQWNIPPLNRILAGTDDEILPSDKSCRDFDEWWSAAKNIQDVVIQINDGVKVK